MVLRRRYITTVKSYAALVHIDVGKKVSLYIPRFDIFLTSTDMMRQYSSGLNSEISLQRSLTVIKGPEFFDVFFIKVKSKTFELSLQRTAKGTISRTKPKVLHGILLGLLESVYINKQVSAIFLLQRCSEGRGKFMAEWILS